MKWGVYCKNFVRIGLTADAGDNFENRAPIPLAPCTSSHVEVVIFLRRFASRPPKLVTGQHSLQLRVGDDVRQLESSLEDLSLPPVATLEWSNSLLLGSWTTSVPLLAASIRLRPQIMLRGVVQQLTVRPRLDHQLLDWFAM